MTGALCRLLRMVKISIGIAAVYLWAMPSGTGNQAPLEQQTPIVEIPPDTSAARDSTPHASSSPLLPPDPTYTQIDSVFQHALDLYGRRQWQAAKGYFDTLAVCHSARRWYARSHLMAALCRMELHEYASAADYLQKAMPSYRLISDHLRFLPATCRMSQEEYGKALYSYELLMQKYPESALYGRALLGALRCRLEKGHAWRVHKQIDSLEKAGFQEDARFSGMYKDLLWIQANACRKLKRYRSEARILSHLLLDGSAIGIHDSCRSRLRQLRERGITREPRGKNAFKAYIVGLRRIQAYPEVIDLIEQRRRQGNLAPGDPYSDWLAFNTAYAHYRMQHYKRADSLFRKTAEQTGDAETARKCRWYVARCRLRAGQTEAAIAVFQSIIAAFPGSKYARLAPFEIVWTHCHSREYQRALQAIETYQTSGRLRGRYRRRVQWMKALVTYLNGEYADALPLFERLARTRTSYRDEARYWAARCLGRMKRIDEARERYEKMAETDQFTWHRLAASQHLAHLETTRPQPPILTPAAPLSFSPTQGHSSTANPATTHEHGVNPPDTSFLRAAGRAGVHTPTDTNVSMPISLQAGPHAAGDNAAEEIRDSSHRTGICPAANHADCFDERTMIPDSIHGRSRPGALQEICERLEREESGLVDDFPSLKKAIVWALLNERNRAGLELKAFVARLSMLDTMVLDTSAFAEEKPPEETRRPVSTNDTAQSDSAIGIMRLLASGREAVDEVDTIEAKMDSRKEDSLRTEVEILRRRKATADALDYEQAMLLTDFLTETGCCYAAYTFFGRYLRNAPEEIVSREYRRRVLYPLAHYHTVRHLADSMGVPLELVLAVMRTESRFNPEAVSPVGARGLMQIMPLTAERIARHIGDISPDRRRLYDPRTNIRYGIWYLKQLLDKFDGSIPLAVASYNGGPFNVERWVALSDGRAWDEIIACMKFSQTRHYTRKVLLTIAVYRRLYADTFTSWNVARPAEFVVCEGIDW